MGVVVSECENFRPFENEIVKFKRCGFVSEILYSQHKSKGGYTKKINKDFYVDTRNGEVKKFIHHQKRIDDYKSISKTIQKIRDIINCNVTDSQKCRFITLTYADNMQDTNKLYNDFKNFYYKKLMKQYPNIEKYIYVIEPQARGAWHIHLILIFDRQAPYMDNNEIEKMWGHGFTNTRKVDNVDNVGAYLSAYLGNITLEEADEAKINTEYAPIKTVNMTDEHGNIVPKKVIKGGRLGFYPVGVHLYRHSKNCLMPNIEYCSNFEAESQVIWDRLTYEKTRNILDTETGFQNTINRRIYNAI